MTKVPKSLIQKRLFIGIGFAIVGYFVFRTLILKKILAKQSGDVNSNFANANGDEGKFVAMKYDPNYQNSDGSLGATWISYNNSDTVGFWRKGFAQKGTPITIL